jgi:hypothetical protein
MRVIFVHFLPAFVASIPMIVLSITIKKFIVINSWFGLSFSVAACVAAYCGSAFYIVLSAAERQKARALISSVPLIKKLGAVFQ